jgi:hypothetical protein
MRVSINQPAYLPWLGYFARIAASDLHIVLDHVQFEKNSYTNRNKVRTKEGWTWLTVPVKSKGRFGELSIRSLEISDTVRWCEKHWGTIKMNYVKTPFFATHSAFFESIYARNWVLLSDLMKEINTYLLGVLDIRTKIVFSSEMGVQGAKDELVLNLCREVGATHYLSGPLGRDYLRENLFHEAGIEVDYHDYQHPTYAQAYGGFESNMAAIDLLFNHGSESKAIMERNQEA